ncbi:RNA polymerase sigma-70 factor [Mangrovibacterium diazotrophicum]|uniref:RNA polymerase sigma-70 factor n=1 Tax=Mangrovibacterium diazotrophicum TaxID=1261403 RepID=UPI0014750E4B|nr:RNA polymerase sigma-70 factor [Mangrovibacterium diazotrophicum]
MEDKYLIAELNRKNKTVFDFVFNYYYSGLCAFVFQIVDNRAVAEDLVQEFFFKIWISKREMEISTSLKSYFFASVKNKAFNYMKHVKVKEDYERYINEKRERDGQSLSWEFSESELADLIEKSIQKLPPRCREIFVLSRFEGKDNESIAAALGISKRTVELQISNALKQLRIELKDYLPLALLLYIIK